MSAVLISVVIPAYNYAHVLVRSVESVLTQLDEDVELVVVDDGSTDSTENVVAQIKLSHKKNFNYIKKQNGGPSSARNVGIDNSTGRFIVFLDADDELMPCAINTIRDRINKENDAELIVASHISVRSNGKQALHRVSPIPEDSYLKAKLYLLSKKIGMSNGAVFFHRKIFEKYRFNEKFRNSEDVPVFAYALANYRVCVESEPLVKIHKHDDSLRHNAVQAKKTGMDLVEEVFCAGRMPLKVLGLKKQYAVQRALSLSRTCFLSQDYFGCIHYYMVALRKSWLVIFRASYTRKVIKSKMKVLIG